MTLIYKTDPFNPDREVLRKVAEFLREGKIVAFPTETVYGLGAIVFNENAVKRIFWAKMRPPDNPLIIHVSNLSMLYEVSVNIPEKAFKLIRVFWPGPLTLVLPRHPNIPKLVTGGLDTIAVRMPAHPVALGLINETGYPIAAPSANLAGKPSPTTAEHVIKDLYGRVDAVVDAGETIYGVESTILNVIDDPPILLRPGAFTVEEIERSLGEKIRIPSFARGFREADIALAPGTKYRHYSPDTPMVLVELPDSIDKLVNTVKSTAYKYINEGHKVCLIVTRETLLEYSSLASQVFVIDIGSRKNVFEIAKNLFKTLRALDDLDCNIAIVEGVEERGLGLTIMNRLRKASKIIIKT